MNPSDLLDNFTKTLREKPALIVGGLIAIFVGAAILNRQGTVPVGDGGDTSSDGADAADTEPADNSLSSTSAYSSPLPSFYSDPTGGYDPGTYYDPGSYYPPVPPDPTPAPIPAPTPTPVPKPVQGCGPKPRIPAGMKGDWKCNQNGRWVWQPTTKPTPPPNKCGSGQVHVSAGRHRILHVNQKAVVTGRGTINVGAAATWCSSIATVAHDGKQALHVVRIESGPHKGQYLNLADGGVRWSRA